MTTARDIIRKALNNVGALTKFDVLSQDEAVDGLADLNALVGMWANDTLLVNARVVETFNLSPNDGEYTIGPVGADLITVRPIFIATASLRDSSGVDYMLKNVSDEEFSSISLKSEQGMPGLFNYDNAAPVAKIKLWPIPTISYQLNILSEKVLGSFTLDTVVDLQPGMDIALWSNLAVLLAPQYGQPVSGELLRLANESKGAIRTSISRVRSADVVPTTFTRVSTRYYESERP